MPLITPEFTSQIVLRLVSLKRHKWKIVTQHARQHNQTLNIKASIDLTKVGLAVKLLRGVVALHQADRTEASLESRGRTAAKMLR